MFNKYPTFSINKPRIQDLYPTDCELILRWTNKMTPSIPNPAKRSSSTHTRVRTKDRRNSSTPAAREPAPLGLNTGFDCSTPKETKAPDQKKTESLYNKLRKLVNKEIYLMVNKPFPCALENTHKYGIGISSGTALRMFDIIIITFILYINIIILAQFLDTMTVKHNQLTH